MVISLYPYCYLLLDNLNPVRNLMEVRNRVVAQKSASSVRENLMMSSCCLSGESECGPRALLTSIPSFLSEFKELSRKDRASAQNVTEKYKFLLSVGNKLFS